MIPELTILAISYTHAYICSYVYVYVLYSYVYVAIWLLHQYDYKHALYI